VAVELPAGVVAVTGEQMRKVLEVAAQNGLPPAAWLDRAAERVVEVAERVAGGLADKRVVVLAGPTASGGIGLAAAARWPQRGAKALVVLARKRKEYVGDLASRIATAEGAGAKVLEGFQEKIFDEAALVVDALLGTELAGPPMGSYSLLIKAANFSMKPVLALEVPSGLDPETGSTPGPCMRAKATVAFGMPRKGLLAATAERATGEVWLADVGLTRETYARAGVAANEPFHDGPLLRLR